MRSRKPKAPGAQVSDPDRTDDQPGEGPNAAAILRSRRAQARARKRASWIAMPLCATLATATLTVPSVQSQETSPGAEPGLGNLFDRAFGPACFDTADIDSAWAEHSVVVCPRLSLTQIYDDNPFRVEGDTRGDFATQAKPSVNLTTSVGNTALSVDGSVTANRQVRFTENNFFDWDLGLNVAPIRQKGGQKAAIEFTGSVNARRQHEGRGDPDSLGEGTDLNAFREVRSEVQAATKVKGITTLLSAGVDRVDFLRSAGTDGDTRDRWTFRNSLTLGTGLLGDRSSGFNNVSVLNDRSFLDGLGIPSTLGKRTRGVGPVSSVSILANLDYERSVFDVDTLSDGREQGNGALGADIAVAYLFSDVTALRLGAGVTQTRFDDPNVDDDLVASVNARLSWLPTDLTFVGARINTALEQTQAGGASASILRDHRIEVEHSIDYNQRIRFDGGFEIETFRGVDRRDIGWGLGVQWDWALNEALLLTAGYRHSARRSNRGGEFTANTISLNLNTRF